MIANEIANNVCIKAMYVRKSGKNFSNRIVKILLVWQPKLPSLSFKRLINKKLNLTYDDKAKYLAFCQIFSEFFKNSLYYYFF